MQQGEVVEEKGRLGVTCSKLVVIHLYCRHSWHAVESRDSCNGPRPGVQRISDTEVVALRVQHEAELD